MIEDKTYGLPIFSYSKTFKTISTKNPDYWVMKKMLTMAEKLNAKIIDDDGEFLDEDFLQMIAPSE